MTKIGVLGGTFDPIHLGHLTISKAAMKEFQLDKIILLPTRVQPFKIGHKAASSHDRVNMARMVASKEDNYMVSTVEAYSKEISYTFNTMNILSEEYKDAKLYFIIGTDSLFTIEKWYKGTKLLQRFSFIVGLRPGYKYFEAIKTIEYLTGKYGTEIKVLDCPMIDVSSTVIKSNIKEANSISELVPEYVERYIDEHGLYK